MSPHRRPLVLALLVACVAATTACRDEAPGSCTLELPGAAERFLVAGTSGQARATATCTHDDAPTVRWRVTDTTLATVTPDGRISGLVPGETRLEATVTGRRAAPVTRSILVRVVPPFLLIPSPSPLVLLPREQRVLGVSRLPLELTPTDFPSDVTFRSADSCVARVSAEGLVQAGRPGSTAIVVALRAAPGVRDTVPTRVEVPAASVLRLEGVTNGGQPVPDSGAVRGTLALQLSLDQGVVAPNGGRLEARIGGQTVSTLLLGPASPGSGVARFPLALDTSVRDAVGQLRFANGLQRVEVALVVPDAPGLPGCPTINLGQVAGRWVTLANLP